MFGRFFCWKIQNYSVCWLNVCFWSSSAFFWCCRKWGWRNQEFSKLVRINNQLYILIICIFKTCINDWNNIDCIWNWWYQTMCRCSRCWPVQGKWVTGSILSTYLYFYIYDSDSRAGRADCLLFCHVLCLYKFWKSLFYNYYTLSEVGSFNDIFIDLFSMFFF